MARVLQHEIVALAAHRSRCTAIWSFLVPVSGGERERDPRFVREVVRPLPFSFPVSNLAANWQGWKKSGGFLRSVTEPPSVRAFTRPWQAPLSRVTCPISQPIKPSLTGRSQTTRRHPDEEVAEEAKGIMRVLFWGTPEFALPALRAVERSGHEGRGRARPDRNAGEDGEFVTSAMRTRSEPRKVRSRGRRALPVAAQTGIANRATHADLGPAP